MLKESFENLISALEDLELTQLDEDQLEQLNSRVRDIELLTRSINDYNAQLENLKE